MPQEKRKRGRRGDKKQKQKRQKTEADQAATVVDNLYIEDYSGQQEPVWQGAGHEEDGGAVTFHGLLTDEEQEYFRRADEMLALDEFASLDEKKLFIANVYREAAGKELKLAHSQGCSRLLERLVVLSSPMQLKALLQCFSAHFLEMTKHRFASHVCETLLLQAAPIVTGEIDGGGAQEGGGEGEVPFASMETLFLHVFHQMLPHLGDLITHTFASHTVRTLILLLAGRPASSAAVLHSRKKEGVSSSTTAPAAAASTGEAKAVVVVPQSFREAVAQVLALVSDNFSVEQLRALAVDRIASPALQIILQIEIALPKKDRRRRAKEGCLLLGRLIGTTEDGGSGGGKGGGGGDDGGRDGDEGRSFFQNLLYDPVGSHLAESLMRAAPKKYFDMLYTRFIRARLASLARNETAAFVVQRVLEKLSGTWLQEAGNEMLAQVPGLVERSRVAVLKSLIDAYIKDSLDPTPIVTAIVSSYSCPTEELVFKMLHITRGDLPIGSGSSSNGEKSTPHPARRDPNQLHGALLAQTMLGLAGDVSAPLCDSLLAQSPDTLVALCRHQRASHVVQRLLTAPHTAVASKRKLLNQLRGRFVQLALDTVASHIVDASWHSPMNYRQAIADELLREEAQMRGSFSGRTVWRNWQMDRYKTRRRQWFALAKEEGGGEKAGTEGIELARRPRP